MNKLMTLLMMIVLLSGCSSIGRNEVLPFRHASSVASYTLQELKARVTEQFRRRHDEASHEFKRYPSPKELAEIEAVARDGDVVIEFKNDDYWVRENQMSKEAARAFCVVRAGKAMKSVSIWELDELNELPDK